VNDILDFSRVEAGKLALEPVPCELRRVLNEITWPLAMQAQSKGLQFGCHVGDEVPEFVSVDRVRLQQILNNLLGNALKFTSLGSIHLRVVQDSYSPASETLLRFSVTDTGIGIAPEKQASIFEAFTQADGSITRAYGGTGLGLAICLRLVRLMGGNIEVSSELGHGSCFSFTVACSVIAAPPEFAAPLTPGIERDRMPGSTLRILLAEDNPINRKVASSLIEKQGHSVKCVADGQLAVEELQQNTYDLIFMDLQMPRMGGLEATGCIRRAELLRGLRPTPIIALTAHAMTGDKERCLQAGMDDYLSKPFRLDELQAKLSKWAGRSTEATEAREVCGAPVRSA
jgi:CheY-like chemotaxis protein